MKHLSLQSGAKGSGRQVGGGKEGRIRKAGVPFKEDIYDLGGNSKRKVEKRLVPSSWPTTGKIVFL